MSVFNQYRAMFRDDDSGELKAIYCNASSMSRAIELMYADMEKEPVSISLSYSNILTEAKTETTVSLTTECVDAEGTVIESGCRVYPSSLSNLTRGNTVYLSAVADDDSVLGFSKWTDDGGNEYTDNPLKITIPSNELVTTVSYSAVFEEL